MAEPMAASPPSPASIPPSDLGGGSIGGGVVTNNKVDVKNKASPDDFLALASRDAAAARKSGSGDSPPPPERKYSSSDVGGGGAPPPTPNNNSGNVSTRSRDRTTKFQFYVPSARSQDGGDSENSNTWGSNRSGSSSSDLERFTESRGGGGSLKNKQQQGSSKKGIDPPEKELPTSSMTAEESARKARSRLIQLQHRESHAGPPSHHHRESHAASGGPHSKVSALGAAQGGGKDGSSGDAAARPTNTGRRSRAGTGSSFVGLDSIEAENEDEDDDDDYPQMNMDPIESDEEPVSDHYDDEGPPNDAGLKLLSQPLPPHNQSPNQSRPNNNDYMKNHPSSAPQRPSHRLPPQQLMQYLHAGGRGSFGRQGGAPSSGGGGGNMFPLPLDSNNGGANQNQQQSSAKHFPRQSQPSSHQQYQQQQQQHRNYDKPRRKSELYSDGINLLEKAVSEARERDEVDTLNDGISYLRNLETALEKGESSSSVQYARPSNLSSSLTVGSSGGMGGMMPPRKAAPPPFPPPPPLARPHRPPPKVSKTGGDAIEHRGRRNSEGDDMEKLAKQFNDAQQQGQQQQQGGQLRIHRPPPPRQPISVPASPTQNRTRPMITAAAAMDYVMSATARPAAGYEADAIDEDDGSGDSDLGGVHVDNDNSDQVTADINKMQTFLNAMIREDGEDAISIEVSGNSNNRPSQKKKAGSFDSVEDHDESDDDASDEDSDDFERNTSLSMHAEAKFGSSQHTSKYAEDKHGTADTVARLDRLELDDTTRRTMKRSSSEPYHYERQRSVDPPEAGDGNDDDYDTANDDDEHTNNNIGTIVSPSVLPMRTMNERLYAIEAVIPTPTRYHHQQELLEDEVHSFDRGMPRLANHEDGGAMHPPSSSHALGPRSNRPGGITGVVLDASSDGENNREYPTRQSSSLVEMVERERSRTADSSSSSSAVSSSQSSSSSDDDHPQDSIADDHPLDGVSQELDKYSSWSGELSAEGTGTVGGEGGGSSKQTSTSLMMNLCSHLLPTMDNSNALSSLLIQNRNGHSVWDDEDPDEPGYVVHHLTNSQLVSVENAFEKMVNLLDLQSSEKFNGSNNKNFERDLEEAELVLDQEEKRYESEAIKKANTDLMSREEDSHTKSDGGQELYQPKRQENEIRECVPDFPGIFPPGMGKTGEMECFYLPIITKSQKTGFEPTKDLALKPGSVFANNYLVQSELGTAAFSTAYRCLDLSSEEDEDGYQDEVCLKVIKNTKDYFDQSLDEIKILQVLKDTGQAQENNVVEMRSFFYHREHLVIVTELLRQNLYEFGKSILESRGPLYFTRLRLSHITRQCLIGLKFVHELGLMHCDIKPENILLSSYSRALVKIIDFGSSSFITDRQSSYIQSRSYRAPEVILGLPYGGKIDMWSLGCVIAELYTNEVTFQNDSELSMLSRIEAICGPFPRHMIAKGRNSHRIFTDSGLIYEKIPSEDGEEDRSQGSSDDDDSEKTLFNVYQPKMTTVAARLGFEEDFMDQPRVTEDDENRAMFVDFVSKLFNIDPDARLSAADALNHPWITSSLDLTEDDIRYGQ